MYVQGFIVEMAGRPRSGFEYGEGMARRLARLTTIALCLLGMTAALGCATKMGSRALPETRIDYNAAIAESAESQMLLNIVRLRYQHSPHFLELNSVVTSFSLTHSGGVNATTNLGNPGGFGAPFSGGANYGVSVTERPTVTYAPLQGEKFVKRLLTPVPPESLLLMLHAGWSADLLFTVLVRQVNDLYGPRYSETGADPGGYGRFVSLLRQLQDQHALGVEFVQEGEHLTPFLVFRPRPGGGLRPEAVEALRMIGVQPGLPAYRLVPFGMTRRPNEIVIHGRSLISAMFFLSQGVAVPGPRDLGRPPLAQPVMRITYTDKKPERAYAAVEYRGRWYYIDETDGASRGPFVLLNSLFSLMSTAGNTAAPVLTVPAG